MVMHLNSSQLAKLECCRFSQRWGRNHPVDSAFAKTRRVDVQTFPHYQWKSIVA